MPSLYWAIHWEWHVHTLDSDTESALIQAIRQHLLGKQVKASDVGNCLEGLAVHLRGTRVTFSAELERIDPVSSFRVDLATNIYVRLAASSDEPSSDHGTAPPSLTADLDDFIMWQMMFDPSKSDAHYMGIYDSLIGIDKETILEEIVSLLAPVEAKERWSDRHYGKQLPLLRAITNKAPVLVFGGDPGTGKTALATSIGAPLAKRLEERVHFRHMSLLMRGMGYQGRAGAMIVKSFERIKSEYSRLREPMLLFFDEAEAIVGSRRQADTSSGSQENIAIVDAIIVGVDSLRKGLQARIVVLFATNLIGHIDAALMRRCYYHSFERPNDRVRRALLESSLREFGFSDADLGILVDSTRPKKIDGVEVPFTHSDIVELIIGRALNKAIQDDKPLTLEVLVDSCRRAIPTRSLVI